jgi:uncharacterized membrane protein
MTQVETTPTAGPSSDVTSQTTSDPGAVEQAFVRTAPLAVWIAAFAYTVVLSSESVSAHRSFVTGFDTALYDQLIWLIAHGHETFSTIVSKPMLADHFQPGLALLAPVSWLGGGVPALLVLQSVALAATGPALYALARESGARPAYAAVPALLWIACPFVARLNLWEFRPTAFASVLLVLSVLGAVRGRFWLLGATALLALSLKEELALVYLALGVILAVQGQRRLGTVVASTSAAWYVVAVLVMRSGGGALDAYGRRFAGERGDSVGDAIVWMLQHPLEATADVVRESLIYVVALVVATGGLALLAPLWLLLALPTAAHNALSAYEPQHLLSYHYHQLTMTALFIAAALGVHRLQGARRGMRVAAGVGVAGAAVLAVAAGSWAHAHWTEGIRLPRQPTDAALALVPPDAPVAASTHLLPHLTHRAEVYTLPEPFLPLDTGSPLTGAEFAERARRVDYVVYRKNDLPVEYQGTAATVLEMLAEQDFVAIARAGPVTVFRRARAS